MLDYSKLKLTYYSKQELLLKLVYLHQWQALPLILYGILIHFIRLVKPSERERARLTVLLK